MSKGLAIQSIRCINILFTVVDVLFIDKNMYYIRSRFHRAKDNMFQRLYLLFEFPNCENAYCKIPLDVN